VPALVFVSPFGESWGSIQGGDHWAARRESCETRYSSLLGELNRISGGVFRMARKLEFGHASADQRPLIISPARRLALRWESEEIELAVTLMYA